MLPRESRITTAFQRLSLKIRSKDCHGIRAVNSAYIGCTGGTKKSSLEFNSRVYVYAGLSTKYSGFCDHIADRFFS